MTWLGRRSFNLIEPLNKNAGRPRKPPQHGPEVSNDQARKTALVVAVVLLLICVWSIYRGRMIVAGVLGSVAALLTLSGLFVPVVARGFHRFWMGVASVLGYVNSRILLSLLYYGLFTSYGLISRLVRDPLRRRGDVEESYWIKRPYTRQTKEQFERLF
jgi:hypothetical protein